MLITTEMELFYYFIASLIFALEFVDTVAFIETRGSFIRFI